MRNFKQHLAESKNIHLEHIEDEIFNRGAIGLREAINFLLSLRNMLLGHSNSRVNVTVKWDGAPAIVVGTDPQSKKFFVATKSAFNKNPKVNYSTSDIYKNHSGPLADKLATVFTLLKPLNIKEILQGDLLYLAEDLKTVVIDGEKCIAFRPNTITYAVPLESDLGKKIARTKLGVVFHTTYTGDSIKDLKASFGANVNKYKNASNSLWINDAYYKDESGTATLTADESAQVTALLSLAGHLFQAIDSSFLNSLARDETLRNLIKTFNNSKVKAGQPIGNVKSHVTELLAFIDQKFQSEIDALKTEKGKQSREDKLKSIKSFIRKSRGAFLGVFEMYNLLTQTKNIIIRKLQSVKSLGTFIETSDGFRVTTPEGFVAVDNISGKAVKLVDRLEFSYANFTVAKDWS